MSKRAKQAALKAYPKEDGKMWHSAFGTIEFDKNAQARKAYQEGYEQAEKDFIERLAKFYPTLDYTFRSYLLHDFPELENKVKNCD